MFHDVSVALEMFNPSGVGPIGLLIFTFPDRRSSIDRPSPINAEPNSIIPKRHNLN